MKWTFSPGSPKPTRNATRINGVPRKKSVYTIARARSGLAPRPGRPRTTAMARAKTSTSASATTISLRFTWKPAQMFGNDISKIVWREEDPENFMHRL